MADRQKPGILVEGDELKKVTKRQRLRAAAKPLTFPPAGDGFSTCQNGLCYVACGDTWYQLVDDNGNQYTCQQGNGLYFDCGTSTYLCTC